MSKTIWPRSNVKSNSNLEEYNGAKCPLSIGLGYKRIVKRGEERREVVSRGIYHVVKRET
jgi:hypothetical protein